MNKIQNTLKFSENHDIIKNSKLTHKNKKEEIWQRKKIVKKWHSTKGTEKTILILPTRILEKCGCQKKKAKRKQPRHLPHEK